MRYAFDIVRGLFVCLKVYIRIFVIFLRPQQMILQLPPLDVIFALEILLSLEIVCHLKMPGM